MKLKIFVAVLAAVSVLADPGDGGFTVDFAGGSAPAVQVYQANAKAFSIRLQNFGVAVTLSNATPYAAWATARGASSMVTAACTVTTAEQGIFRAVWTPADLNTNGAFFYEVGLLVNEKPVTARQGQFTILPDFYASGASPLTFAQNVNCALYNWINAPWDDGTIVASNAAYATSSGYATNAGAALVWTGHSATDFATAAQGIKADNAAPASALTNYPTLTMFNAQAQDVAVLHSQANILNTGKLDIVTWRDGSNTLAAATDTAQSRADDAYQLAASLTNSSGGSITGSYVSGITLGGGAALTGTVALGTAALLDSNNVAQLNTINGVHNFTIKASDSISDGLYGGYINIPDLPAPGMGIYAHGYVTIGPALNIVTDGSLQGDPAFTINGVEVNTANIANIGLTASNALAMATTNSTTIATFGNIVTHNANEFATWGATNVLISTGAFWNAMTAYTATTNLGSAAFADSNKFVRSVTVNGSTSNVNAGGNVNLGTISGGASSGTNGTTSAWTNGAGVVTASINPATGNYIGGTFNGVTVTQAQTWCAGFCYITGGTFILASNAVNPATYSVLTPLPAYATNIINVSGNIAFTRSNLVGAAISNLCVEVYRENIGGSSPDGLCLIPLQSADYFGTGSGYDYYHFSRPLTNKTFATSGNYSYAFGYAQVFLRNLGYAGPVSNLLGCATVEVSK